MSPDKMGRGVPVTGIGGFDGWRSRLALAFALVAAQAALWLNPGYFSHDELQWGARAAVEHWRDLPLESFSDWRSFQFRPLTFNLWLLLSHALFDTPRLFHAILVALGTLNALLLARVLRGTGCRNGVASGAALAFGLSPFAAWVHGWVGCLADLLWVGLGLGIVATLQRLDATAVGGDEDTGRRGGRFSWIIAAVTAALATALALLSKEAALSIPALLGLGALVLRLRRTWLAAALASAAVALAYLALRLTVLTAAPHDSTYDPAWAAVPRGWAMYQLFPWALGVSEVHVLALASPQRLALYALLFAAFAIALWRASPRLWLVWLAGGALALAPALALPVPSNQYGYGFAALGCGAAALAWVRLRRGGRITLVLLAILALVHGAQIQKHMLETGRLQAVFSPSLADAARAQPEGDIRLWPDAPKQGFAYARLSHDIPAYRGVPLGPRVQMARNRDEATHRITAAGRVQAMGEPQ